MLQRRAVIVGGGTMGADVAAIFAAGGMGVDIVQRPGKTRDTLRERVDQIGRASCRERV